MRKLNAMLAAVGAVALVTASLTYTPAAVAAASHSVSEVQLMEQPEPQQYGSYSLKSQQTLLAHSPSEAHSTS